MANESTPQTRIFLQPIAGPQVLGLYGLAASTFLLSAYWAHWFGSAASPLFLFPFVALFGGLAQFLAGMWAYRARDVLATAMHGLWGTLFMAYGLLVLISLSARVALPVGPPFPELGFWFIPTAAITWVLTFAAKTESKSLVTVLMLLSIGSTLGAIAFLGALTGVLEIAAYFLLGASFAAWYTASGVLLRECFGREVFKIGRTGRLSMASVMGGEGEAGVVRGQA
jgi:succinate-acetate transporter protein